MDFCARFAALTLLLTSSAHATIGLPTIQSVPIPAGTLIHNGGGATLDNYVSQDLFANTAADWTTAAIVIELTAGSIYQDALGGATEPITSVVPSLAPTRRGSAPVLTGRRVISAILCTSTMKPPA